MSRTGLRVILITVTIFCILIGSIANLRFARGSGQEETDNPGYAEHMIETEPYTSVDVMLPAGTVYLVISSDFYGVEYDGPEEFFPEYKVENKTLRVTCPAKDFHLSDFGEDMPQYWIYVGQSGGLLSAKIRVEAGELNVDGVQCIQADFSCEAGNIESSSCTFQKARLDVEIGNVQINDADAGQMDISVETGNINITTSRSILEKGTVRLTTELGAVIVNGEEQDKNSVVLGKTNAAGEEAGNYIDAHVEVGTIYFDQEGSS